MVVSSWFLGTWGGFRVFVVVLAGAAMVWLVGRRWSDFGAVGLSVAMVVGSAVGWCGQQ